MGFNNMWEIESQCISDGHTPLCGVDEAGRGALAGPVFAAAVILPYGMDIKHLNDSKTLSAKVRDTLYDIIIKEANDYGIAFATHDEVDDLNVLNATYIAMNRAIENLRTCPPAMALVDGNRNKGISISSMCIIDGDKRSASIAAASILAKVSRDRHMIKLAGKYPCYGFDKHKGYGTKAHYDMLFAHGVSEVHRRTFLKKTKLL